MVDRIARRDFVAGGIGAGLAAAIPTRSASAFITLERNRPRGGGAFAPPWRLPAHTRLWLMQRAKLRERREERRHELWWRACRNERGAIYRYMRFSWTHMHPFREWPTWWAEQNDRLRWAHERAGIAYRPWTRGHGPIMDPGLARELARRGLLGQILIQSGSRYADDEESGVPAGAFVLDVDNLSGVASDQNDGIWDSDGPWATYSRLERELEAGMFMPGDTILIRAGDLVHRRVAYWTGGGTTAQADKILVMSWPGERCHFDFATNNDDTMLDAGSGTGPVIFEEGNFRLKSLDFTSYKRGFATRLNGPCPGCEFVDLTRTRFGSATSGGNSAGCLIVDGGADDYLIEGCDLSDGNEVSNNNGSTVYSIYSFGIVRGNHIGASGTMGGAYHLKRNNPAPTLGDWTFENNIVVRTGPSRLCCGLNNMDRSLIQHNLLVSANSGGSALYGSQSGTGASPWYANEVLHNTCFQVGLCGIDNNNAPNRRNGSSNVVYDNISDGQLSIMPNQIEYTHGNDLDYNLYSSDFFEFNATYPSLRSWRRNDRYFGAFAAHDDHSVEETVAWAGKPGVPVSHNDLSAFELSTISAGFKTASDMTNMGADLSLVGPAAYGY